MGDRSGKVSISDRVEDAISRVGWFATGVFASEDGDSAPFVYSAGFNETLEIPDMVIIGFDPQLSHSILASVYEQVKAGNVTIPDEGGKVERIIQDFSVRLTPVPEELLPDFAGVTLQRDETTGVKTRVMHLVFPDKNGKFAGEPGADEEYAARQALRNILSEPGVGPQLH